MSNIRYRSKDKDLLKRKINNYNAKVRRLEKKGFDFTPERIKLKDVQQEITTRADFDRQIKLMDNFLKKGSERLKENKHGIKAPEFMIKNLKELDRVVTKKMNEGRKKAKVDTSPITRMGRIKDHDYKSKPFKFDDVKTDEELNIKLRRLKDKARDDYLDRMQTLYKNNYIQSLEGYTDEQLDYLKQLIELVSKGNLFDFKFIDERFEIGFNYDDLIDTNDRYELLKQAWEEELTKRRIDFSHIKPNGLNTNVRFTLK